jgi:hypothetical protein
MSRHILCPTSVFAARLVGLTLVLITVSALPAIGDTYYVSTTGSDGNPGTMGLPFATIQHGIDVAGGGDSVLVMAGVYTGTGNRNLGTQGKAITVRGISGSASTVISCGMLHNGFDLDFSGEDSTTVIQGFTITHAVHGFYIYASAPKIRDVRIVSPMTTGVRLLAHEELTEPIVLIDCEFTDCPTGLYTSVAFDDDHCQVRQCTFTDCATGARGLFTMYGCTFSGGTNGVEAQEALSYQTLANCSFTGFTGAALRPDPEDLSELTVDGCLFTANPGDVIRASSIETEYLTLELIDCEMRDNGGGIALSGNFLDVTMSGCLYAGNGGPLDYSGDFGGSLTITGCTVADGTGAGLLIESLNAPIDIGNTIVAFNTGCGIDIVMAGGGYTIACCDAYGNAGGNYCTIPDPTGSSGNISSDPQFCDRPAGKYSLRSTSPCAAANYPGCGQIGAFGVGCGVWFVSTTGSNANPGTSAAPFRTIQYGVNTAAAGDTVIVFDGVYTEHVAVSKGLDLWSYNGDPQTCTIEALPGYRVLTATGTLDAITIAGFEIRGGHPAQGDYGGLDLGGGIFAAGPYLVVRDCWIHHNVVPADQPTSSGGGIHVRDGSHLYLSGCRIEHNEAPRAGGVIVREDGGAELLGNVIVDNEAVWNSGGVWILPDVPTMTPHVVVGNTIAGNITTAGGEGLRINVVQNLTLENNIVARNDCVGGQVGLFGMTPAMSCNVVYPEAYASDLVQDTSGNIHVDPQFCNQAMGDYAIAETSPAAPPNSSGCGLIGALGIGCDLTGVAQENETAIPEHCVLLGARPNPFNPMTTIVYELPRPLAVDLAVYDVAGRLVKTLRAGAVEEAGHREAVWRGDDEQGRQVAAGVYLCRLRAGDVVAVRSLVLVR